MKSCFLSMLLISGHGCSFAQDSLQQVLRAWNEGTIPYIYVAQVYEAGPYIFLDARERREFEVSHLPNAIWVGYSDFKLERFRELCPDTGKKLMVYCSLGVRSEDIGEKLREAGYEHVRNLYGGIFEWTKQGLKVVYSLGRETERVHAFDKRWGMYLSKAEKVYH